MGFRKMSEDNPGTDFVLLIVIFGSLAMIVRSVIGLLYLASSVATR